MVNIVEVVVRLQFLFECGKVVVKRRLRDVVRRHGGHGIKQSVKGCRKTLKPSAAGAEGCQ